MSHDLVKQAKPVAESLSERAAAFGKFCHALGDWYLSLKKYNCHY